jgi:hypothetical protein
MLYIQLESNDGRVFHRIYYAEDGDLNLNHQELRGAADKNILRNWTGRIDGKGLLFQFRNNCVLVKSEGYIASINKIDLQPGLDMPLGKGEYLLGIGLMNVINLKLTVASTD